MTSVQKIEKTLNNTNTTKQKLTTSGFRNTKSFDLRRTAWPFEILGMLKSLCSLLFCYYIILVFVKQQDLDTVIIIKVLVSTIKKHPIKGVASHSSRNHFWIAKSQLSVWNKYVSQAIYITIRTGKTSFANKFSKPSIAICFNLLYICPSVPCFSFYDVLFLPSYLTVWAVIFVSPRENRYLLVSLNLVAIYSLHFDKFRDIVHTVSLMAANLDGTW